MAEIYDRGSRSAVALIGGVGLQIVRDWGVRFNARVPEGLLDVKAPGKRSRIDDAQRLTLVDVVKRGPIPATHGVVRWRLIDLVQWLYEEVAVSLDETTVGRELEKRDRQDFRVWAGKKDTRETHNVPTQGAGDPG